MNSRREMPPSAMMTPPRMNRGTARMGVESAPDSVKLINWSTGAPAFIKYWAKDVMGVKYKVLDQSSWYFSDTVLVVFYLDGNIVS